MRASVRKAVKPLVQMPALEGGRVAHCAGAHPLLQLPRAVGNQAVLGLLRGGVLQAKLEVGAPGDAYEQEADRVAAEVTRTAPGPVVQRRCACGGIPGPDGECAVCRAKRLARQHQSAGLTGRAVAPPIVGQVLRSPGQPLDAATRAFFEPRFGHDFRQVRVHVDAEAAESACAVNALAYTVGPHLVFGTGQYAPSLPAGRRLLAHELVHVVQQGHQGQDRSPIQRQGGHPGVEGQRGGGSATCPTKTAVDKTIDMTPAGLQKGYGTGYGIATVIRVEPDSQNWDRTQVPESFPDPGKNTCPPEFGISPCTGNDTFTVGAAAKSSILGDLAATRNRFYDFHITRWNKGSLLHEPTRNPKGIDSCQITCEQNYSCGGAVIGKHTITRNFKKGKQGTRDVTVVEVTKT